MAVFKMSNSGLYNLIKHEGMRLLPYDDQTGKTIKNWCKGATIGVGHLITHGDWEKYKRGINNSEAVILLKKDVKWVEDIVNKRVKATISGNQFDALCMLVFNIGGANFRTSSVLRMINKPGSKTNYPTLEKAWMAWNKSQGRVMKGLNNRRKAEWILYNG